MTAFRCESYGTSSVSCPLCRCIDKPCRLRKTVHGVMAGRDRWETATIPTGLPPGSGSERRSGSPLLGGGQQALIGPDGGGEVRPSER
jgi:hypothetical protein